MTTLSLITKRKGSQITTGNKAYHFPYGKTVPKPSVKNPIVRVYADPELAAEAFRYALKSGEEGTVHVDQVFECNVSSPVEK